MPDLIDTTEMYLRTLYELIEEGITPMRARIVERLNQAGPTVSQTVARMERDGLLIVGDDRAIILTDEGLDRAVTVMRRHRLAECMLTQTLGIGLDAAHDEACRWEHVMTDLIEGRVDELLDSPTTSPYGLPSPLASEQRPHDPDSFRDARHTVRASVDASGSTRGTVTGIAEWVQATGWLMADLSAAGVLPGADIEIVANDHDYVITVADGGEIRLAAEFADGVYLSEH